MEQTLQHIIAGKVNGDQEAASGALQALAHSAGIAATDAAAIRQNVLLEPFAEPPHRTLAVISRDANTIVANPERTFIVAAADLAATEPHHPRYHYVIVPGAVLREAGGDLDVVSKIAGSVETPDGSTRLDPLPVPPAVIWTLEKRTRYLREMISCLPDGDMELAFALLGAALHERRLMIQNFTGGLEQRLKLLQGLLVLLPQPARPLLTFTTHTATLPGSNEGPSIVFSAGEGESNRWSMDWSAPEKPPVLLNVPYVTYLRKMWDDDVLAFATALRELEPIASALMPGVPLLDALALVTARHAQDRIIAGGGSVPVNELVDVLQSPFPPQGELRVKYIQGLLQHALSERDTDAAGLIARELDNNPELDSQLSAVFEEALDAQPDAVYVFVRTRLAEGITERWLDRLKQAAEYSLDVAISSGEPATIASWLRLISREPARYELGDILHAGIVAAQERAREDAELARELIVIAIKRAPEMLDTLLTNPDVLAPLSDEMRAVIEDYDSEAMVEVADESREIFLMAVKRAIDNDIQAVNTDVALKLWDIYQAQPNIVVAEPFRPLTLIRKLVAGEGNSLQPGAHERLLSQMLTDAADDEIMDAIRVLLERDATANYTMIEKVLTQGTRTSDELLDIIVSLQSSGIITPQESADMLIELLDERGWSTDHVTLVEQLARILNQNADVTVNTSSLWKMLELAAETRSELMTRAALRRIVSDTAAVVVEDKLVDNLERLRRTTAWNATARGQMMQWWRGYVNEQSMNALQKIDRALESKKPIDDLRQVVQTTIATRRLMGTRSLSEFAAGVAAALSILQSISDGFDPEGKQPAVVDVATLRYILDERTEDLPPDVAHVLAANLKELAQLITGMAENRTKPSLIRSDDTVERQLYSGEFAPQSGVDALKWLSGYLDGTHSGGSDADDS